MKKRIPSLICFLMTFNMVLSMMSFDVFARTYSSRSSSSSGAVFIIQLILMVIVAIALPILKNISKNSSKNNKNTDPHVFKSDFDKGYRDGFGNINRIEDIFVPRNSDGLTEDEQLMVDVFSAAAKARKPDPVEIKCPNCGAPVMLSDKIVCPYCRTEISNRSVAQNMKIVKDRTVIAPEDYNPRRYYDENMTGYGLHDVNNTEEDEYYVKTISPSQKDDYKSNSRPSRTNTSNHSTSQNYPHNNGSNNTNEWGSGFLGGYFDDDHR